MSSREYKARTFEECCAIAQCKDRLTALIKYQASENEWKQEIEWFRTCFVISRERR